MTLKVLIFMYKKYSIFTKKTDKKLGQNFLDGVSFLPLEQREEVREAKLFQSLLRLDISFRQSSFVATRENKGD
jgi:hypothetical protein